MCCVLTYASFHFLISIYIVITLISQVGENKVFYLVFEALLTNSVVLGRFDAVLKATSASFAVGNLSNSKHMDFNRLVKLTL